MRSLRLPAAIVLAAALVPAAAAATVMVEVPVDDMAYVADAIVIGHVDRVGTRLELSGPEPMPWTVSTIAVDRWVFGQGAQTGAANQDKEIVIEELGGTFRGETVHVAGTPEYTPGEQVLVFLRRDERGRFRTYGMAQGKFTIRVAVDGPARVTRDLGDIAFAQWTSRGMEVDHATPTTSSLPALLNRVQAVLEVRR